jgi:hemerythrin-like metal-binding protein
MAEIYQFKWTKEISVHEAVIDLQHQRLLEQVNKLIDATLTKFDMEVLTQAVNFFDDYIKEHFRYEENYMLSVGYPEIGKHLEMHRDFIEHYGLFKKEVDVRGSPETLLKMETYIGNWWLNHIGKEDKKYAIYADNKIKSLNK